MGIRICTKFPIHTDVAEMIPRDIAVKHKCIPIVITEVGVLVLAISNPLNEEVIAEVKKITGMSNVCPSWASESEILGLIDEIYIKEDEK